MKAFKVVSFVLIFALIFSSCVKKQKTDSPDEQATPTAKNVSEILKVERRTDLAPNFSWKDSSGNTVDFNSYKGKVTLVNFWATWCVPCKKELPDLVALSKELADRNVKLIGISTDRGPNTIENLQTFVHEHGIPYQIVVSNSEIEEAFGNVNMMPTSFLLDEQGRVVQTIIGARDRRFFSEAIAAILK